MTYPSKLMIVVGCLLLAACGGSGETPPVTTPPAPAYVGLFDTGATGSSNLVTRSSEGGANSIDETADNLNRSSDTVTLNGLTGTIDDDREIITFATGGTATLTNGSTDYVALFLAQPIGADPFFGVIGVPTAGADLPNANSATYSGSNSAVIQVVHGSTFLDLQGDVAATVNFQGESLTIVFDQMDGIKIEGVSAPTGVSDALNFSIDGAIASDGSFTGSVATVSSLESGGSLSGDESVVASGAFYGPNADELGGLVTIDDTGTGTLLISGRFVAD